MKKLNSSCSESESPFDKTPSKPPIGAKTENKIRADSTSRSQQDVLSSDVDSTTQAVEVRIFLTLLTFFFKNSYFPENEYV